MISSSVFNRMWCSSIAAYPQRRLALVLLASGWYGILPNVLRRCSVQAVQTEKQFQNYLWEYFDFSAESLSFPDYVLETILEASCEIGLLCFCLLYHKLIRNKVTSPFFQMNNASVFLFIATSLSGDYLLHSNMYFGKFTWNIIY